MKKLSKIEFYTSPEGEVMIREEDRPVRELTVSDIDFVSTMFERIRRDYTEAFEAMWETYKASEKNKPFFRYLIVRRFIRCNWSNYDTMSADISDDGEFNFEQVSCPMRGECQLDGIVCMPKYNMNLTPTELTVLELYCRPMEIQYVAKELFISENTAKVHLNNIRKKLNVHDKAGLMKFWENKMK